MVTIAYSLRCTHCGAPLPQPKKGEEYVKCDYCGYLNRVVDSQVYLESLRREVAKWLSQLLPQTAIVSTTADPVARYHLFQGYVKPMLIPLSVNAKTKFVEALYSPLTVIGSLTEVRCEDPKKMFEDSIKLEAVGDLAVDEGDKAFLTQTFRNLQVAAFICNALRDAAEEKFIESANSISEVLNYMPESEHKSALERLKLAKSFYTALGELISRNPLSALSIISNAEKTAERILSELGNRAFESLAALEVEVDHIRIVKSIAEVSSAYFENGLDPLQPYVVLKRAVGLAVENARRYSRPIKDVLKVAEECRKTFLSRLRKGTIKVAGLGDLLVPFYLVETSITYTQGIVFRKGRDLRAKLLVSGSPPAVSGISDVFGIYQGRQIPLEQEQDYVKVVDNIVEVARETYPSVRLVLPLISPITAEKIADEYIDRARGRYGDRIKLSSTVARDLIYVAGRTEGTIVRLPHPLVTKVEKPDALKEVTI